MKMYCLATAVALGATFVLLDACVLHAGAGPVLTANIVQLH